MSETEDRVRPLLEQLKSEDPWWRVGAAYHLSRLGPADGSAVEALVQALREDPIPSVRSTAAWAIGVIGPAHAVSPLAEALKDPAWAVRTHAAQALGLAGPAAAAAVPALTAALADPDSGVRAMSRHALRAIRGS